MSHNVETMMYAGEVPWHGLGTFVGDQDVTTAEAIVAAQLDWKVEARPIKIEQKTVIETNEVDGDGNTTLRKEIVSEWLSNDKFVALTRDKDNQVYAVVTDRYEPVQNSEAFDWFDSVAATGAAKIHTCGSLQDGKVVWVLAQVEGNIQVATNDGVDKYVLFTTRHDGLGAIDIKFTPVRVVCNNTLSMALGQQSRGLHIKHSGNVADKLQQAKKILGIIQRGYDSIETKLRLLAENNVTDRVVFDNYIVPFGASIFGYVVTPTPEELTKAIHSELVHESQQAQRYDHWLDSVGAIFMKSDKLQAPEISGTLWKGYNAITEYYDHSLPFGRNRKNPETRMKSLIYGDRANIKEAALIKALELV